MLVTECEASGGVGNVIARPERLVRHSSNLSSAAPVSSDLEMKPKAPLVSISGPYSLASEQTAG